MGKIKGKIANKPKSRAKSRRKKHPKITKLTIVAVIALALWGVLAEWFVHHSPKWIDEANASMPSLITVPLLRFGNPLADITDALDLTGHDAIYEYDTEAPDGEISFAGLPQRIGAPAPDDIRILDRGEFTIGWSDSLRHPVWCAYHVPAAAPYENTPRPVFTHDRSVQLSPDPKDYTKSGYDRGHMVPNYAIVTRFGKEMQKQTFKMSNISPQRPALNRGVWRDLEYRIAKFWPSAYGEIWVVVGTIPGNGETLPNTDIDVPTGFYMVVVAQKEMDVRAFAVLLDQNAGWNEWAARRLISIDELEKITGLDFNPELPSFIQDPLEAELPTRLWPIRFVDVFQLVISWFM